MVTVLAIITITPYLYGAMSRFPDRMLPLDFIITISAVVLMASLFLKDNYPYWCLGLAFLGTGCQVMFSPMPTLPLVAVPIVVYSFARMVIGKPARLAVVFGGFASVFGPPHWVYASATSQDEITILFTIFLTMGLCFATVITSYLLGRRVQETEIAEHQYQLAQRRAYEQKIWAAQQRSRIEESRIRNDIARELHDVVAHSLSVMIVQAEGGRALAAKKPQASIEALDTIAATGREALTEMRRIVGVLRKETTPAEYAPNPTLADITSLVERCGPRVSLNVEGACVSVPQTLATTVYRVVQEALTNFLKHAGPEALASVTLRFCESKLEVCVVDNGVGSLAINDGEGNGLRGMQERVAAMNGNLLAHPLITGNGFIVQATFPIKT